MEVVGSIPIVSTIFNIPAPTVVTTPTDATSPKVLVLAPSSEIGEELSYALELSGINADTPANTHDALEVLNNCTECEVDSILLELSKSGQTEALSFLEQTSARHPELSVLLIDSEQTQEQCHTALRQGAFAAISRPFDIRDLHQSVRRAVDATHKMRELRASQNQLKASEALHACIRQLPLQDQQRIDIAVSPPAALGSDFILPLKSSEESKLGVFLGDTSGHDLPAALLATYIQGLVQGLHASESAPDRIFLALNTLLHEQWPNIRKQLSQGKNQEEFIDRSLAAIHLEHDSKTRTLHVINAGMPEPVLLRKDLSIHPLNQQAYPPLGWFAQSEFYGIESSTRNALCAYLLSDGLYNFADRKNIDPFALIYQLLEKDNPSLEATTDDLLCCRLSLEEKLEIHAIPHPLIHQQYPAEAFRRIDQLQALWKHSLHFALPQASPPKISEVLIACREAILIALVQAAQQASGGMTTLSVFYIPQSKMLKILIRAPQGNSFCTNEIQQGSENAELGLAVLQSLAENISLLDGNSQLSFDFKL